MNPLAHLKHRSPLLAIRYVFAGLCAALCVATSALPLSLGTASAQTAGDLDPSFGSGGKAAFTPYLGGAADLALQPDGKIIAGGLVAVSSMLSDDFGVSRYNADGSLDATFGNAGTASLNFDLYGPANGVAIQGSADRIGSLALQPDGKILAAGYTYEYIYGTYNDASFAVARFNADGSLDTTFGTAGKIKLHVGRGVEIQYGTVGMVLQADGKFVIAGAVATPSSIIGGGDIVLARYNPDGTADAAFGVGGVVQTHLLSQDGSKGIMSHLVAQPDGKLVVVGQVTQNTVNGVTQGGAVFLRYNADGTLDPGFANGGVLVFDQSAAGAGATVYDTLTDVQFEPDGKLLGVGTSYASGTRQVLTFLVRLNANGSVDTTYGTNGFVITILTPSGAARLRRQSDGKYLVSETDDGSNLDFLLARFNNDGTVDKGFGTIHGGYAETDFEGGDDVSPAILLQPDGKVILGGAAAIASSQPAGERFALARYLTSGTAAAHPPFFAGEAALANGVYYLQFVGSGNPFGYYSYLADAHYIYHFDLGYEYVFDAADGRGGVYLYDFKSGGFFYTSPTFPFPYLYDFSLNSVVYYYPDPANAGRYNTNGTRYFYVFGTGQIISK